MYVASFKTRSGRQFLAIMPLPWCEYNGKKYTPSFVIATLKDMIKAGSEMHSEDLWRRFSPTLTMVHDAKCEHTTRSLVLFTRDFEKEVVFITFMEDVLIL